MPTINIPLNSAKTCFTSVHVLCLFLIYLFLSLPTIYAKHSVDSLDLKKRSADLESTRLQHYLKLAQNYRSNQPDSGIYYANRAKQMAQQSNNTNAEILALRELGISMKNKGNYQKALNHYFEGLQKNERLNDKKISAAFFNNIGNVYQRLAELDSALIYYLKSLKLKEELDDQKGIAKSYNNLGIFSASREDFEASKNYFLKCLNLERKLGNEKYAARAEMNLGNTYTYLGKLDSAVFYYEKSLKVQLAENNQRSIARILMNLGNVYKEMGNYEIAANYYQESLDLKLILDNPPLLSTVYYNLGHLNWLSKNFEVAIKYLGKSLEMTKSEQLLARQQAIHQYLASCYEELALFDKGLIHHKTYKKLSDSIYQMEKDKVIEELNIQYKTEKREKELALQQAENQRKTAQRNYFILSSIFLLISLLIAGRAYQQKKIANQKLASQNEIISTREKEKALLLRELHHRVKNNLQLVSSLLNLQAHQLKDSSAGLAVKEGQSRVEAMALIHRDLYLKEESTKVELDSYVGKMVENLLQAFGKSISDLKVNQQIEVGKIDADVAIPLGLILNELITNALKYAFKGVENPRLDILARIEDNGNLFLEVKDNGIGINTKAEKKTSFGMIMVQSLAKQLKAKYQQLNENGYAIQFMVPLRNYSLALT